MTENQIEIKKINKDKQLTLIIYFKKHGAGAQQQMSDKRVL